MSAADQPHPLRTPDAADSIIADGVNEGWLSPAVNLGSALPDRQPTTTLARLLEELAEDRSER